MAGKKLTKKEKLKSKIVLILIASGFLLSISSMITNDGLPFLTGFLENSITMALGIIGIVYVITKLGEL